MSAEREYKIEREYKLVTPASRINRDKVVSDVWKAIGKRKQPKPFAHSETTVPVQLLEALLILCGEGDAPEDKKEKVSQ